MMWRLFGTGSAAWRRWRGLRSLAFLALAAVLASCTDATAPAQRSDTAPEVQRVAISAPVAISAQRRVALVIGNGAYPADRRPLRNPARDARLMAEVLRGAGFEIILGTDRTKRQMEDLIRQFSNRLRGGQLGVVFYAGHGMQVDGENWLLPVDANPQDKQDLPFEAISLTTILGTAESAAPINLIFVDACRDNPLARRFRLAGTRSAAEAVGLADPSFLTRSSRAPAGNRGPDTNEGTLIAFATAPNTTADDGDGLPNSPFTAALARHLATPGLDIRLAMARVTRDVLTATARQQRPWENSSLTAELVLVPVFASQTIAQTAAPAPVVPPQGPPTVAASFQQAAAPLAQGTVATQPAATPFPLSAGPTMPTPVAPLTPENSATRPPVAPVRNSQFAFRCPQVGTTVERDDGVTVQYLGPDPTDPQMCLRMENGRRESYLFDIARLPLHDERSLRAGLAQLWPLEFNAAKVVRYTTNEFSGPSTFFYEDTWKALRVESVFVGGSARDVVVIQIEQAGQFENNSRSVRTRWWDIQTGAFLKFESRWVAGPPRQPASWQAVRVSSPTSSPTGAYLPSPSIQPAAVASTIAGPLAFPPPFGAGASLSQPTSGGPFQFRCPQPGVVVERSDGARIRYDSTDKLDPQVCVIDRGGSKERWLYGLFPLPFDGERDLASGLARLWPAAPGRSVRYHYSTQRPPSVTPLTTSFRYFDDWNITSSESIPIGNSVRQALRIERSRQGLFNNSHELDSVLWWDIETGV